MSCGRALASRSAREWSRSCRSSAGIEVSHETVRRWGAKFGPALARNLRRRALRPGDIRHLDEVRVVVRGRVHRLWRAVDQHGIVPGETLQRRRDKRAARRLLTTLLRKQGGRPRRIVTDRLASCGAAKRELMPGPEHRANKGLDNRAENSHVPFRRRERQMQGFRSAGGAAALRLGLLRHAQPVRPARSPPIRARHPPSPPRSARRVAPGRRPRRLRPPAISAFHGRQPLVWQLRYTAAPRTLRPRAPRRAVRPPRRRDRRGPRAARR